MYYPYFRGKQYELITIRESAELLSSAGFLPVIEPVKQALGGLQKSLDAIVDAKGEAVLIVNPFHGDHSGNGQNLVDFFNSELSDYLDISPGILLSEGTTLDEALRLSSEFGGRLLTFVHSGFAEAKSLAESLPGGGTYRHIFSEDSCGKLYQRHFKDFQRILLRDGFQKRTNREHPEVEFFSDLHATYMDEGMNGFGDFLIVGDDYSESGGPAYAIAIHLTFIDPDKDDEMHIHHFKSVRQDDPKDPAGKFAEALEKLIEEVRSPNTKILRTSAIEEFLDLHKRGHFPGLGYIKKLSMKHHLETLADYFSQKSEA